jgi:hypothetical protein
MYCKTWQSGSAYQELIEGLSPSSLVGQGEWAELNGNDCFLCLKIPLMQPIWI